MTTRARFTDRPTSWPGAGQHPGHITAAQVRRSRGSRGWGAGRFRPPQWSCQRPKAKAAERLAKWDGRFENEARSALPPAAYPKADSTPHRRWRWPPPRQGDFLDLCFTCRRQPGRYRRNCCSETDTQVSSGPSPLYEFSSA
jgi:hypothetical protein